MPIFGDLAKLFMGGGPLNWEIARQMARWLAAEGQTATANPDPLDRIRLEELARVAHLHVREVSGLDPAPEAAGPSVDAISRPDWANRTLDDLHDVLERLATSIGAAPVEDGPDELLGNLGQVLAPVMMGFTVGSMVGHLARRALAQYDLPIPRPGRSLMVVSEAVGQFASDWSLPGDDVRMWICVHELTHQAVFAVPGVRERFDQLLLEYAGGFRPDPSALEGQMAGIDPTDPSTFQAVFGDPETLLGAVRTPEQEHTLARLSALVAAVTGFVDHVLDTLGGRLIGSYGPITEALRRRRVESAEGDRFVERLLGLEMDQAQYDRGERFAQGIVERAGTDGLARLWADPSNLPTPAEVDAPGLWLARIDL
jgi:putative hydrolase